MRSYLMQNLVDYVILGHGHQIWYVIGSSDSWRQITIAWQIDAGHQVNLWVLLVNMLLTKCTKCPLNEGDDYLHVSSQNIDHASWFDGARGNWHCWLHFYIISHIEQSGSSLNLTMAYWSSSKRRGGRGEEVSSFLSFSDTVYIIILLLIWLFI